MRKQHIIILGIVFGLSLLGLILLQIGYFQRASEVKRQQFVFTVYKSMDEVIDYIREKEKSYHDAEGTKLLVQEDGNIGWTIPPGREHAYTLSEPPFSFEKEAIQETNALFGTQIKEDNLKRSILKLQQDIREKLGKEYNLVFEKQESQEGRLASIFSLDELQLVIEERLEDNRIKDHAEFGIKEGGKFAVVSQQFNRYAEEYAFNKKIFPRRGEDSAVLYLKFPNQSKDNQATLLMLLPSIIIIIALVGCSVFCFVVIIRQKKLSAIKNDFINNMTHEFKTPLATISLASQMLKDGAVSNTAEGIGQIATIMLDESKRLTYQVERILQTALFTENRIRLKLKKVKINDMVADFLPKLSLRVEDKGGAVTAELLAEDDELQADEVHVTNVLSNLVDNAIKYSVRTPEITIRTLNRDQYIVISVIDNGIGIAKKDQKLIFERFYRVSTGNLHDVKGFGLGLSYVKKIIEAHGGYVEVDSSLEKGSSFDIVLPLMIKKEKIKRTLFF